MVSVLIQNAEGMQLMTVEKHIKVAMSKETYYNLLTELQDSPHEKLSQLMRRKLMQPVENAIELHNKKLNPFGDIHIHRNLRISDDLFIRICTRAKETPYKPYELYRIMMAIPLKNLI